MPEETLKNLLGVIQHSFYKCSQSFVVSCRKASTNVAGVQNRSPLPSNKDAPSAKQLPMSLLEGFCSLVEGA